jgi:uncharacterized membrane protein (UPF0127 family)
LGRDGLESGEGLWIVPCEAIHTFGMRFSIDLVYVDRSNRVRKVRSSVPPWRLSACLSAHSVVELASGTVRETQTKAGDKLEFSPLSPLEQTVKRSHLCTPTLSPPFEQHPCCRMLAPVMGFEPGEGHSCVRMSRHCPCRVNGRIVLKDHVYGSSHPAAARLTNHWVIWGKAFRSGMALHLL